MKAHIFPCLMRIVATSARDSARAYTAILGSGAFLCVILYIFHALWGVLAAERGWQVSPLILIWYLAYTELPMMSPPRVTREVEADVSAGTFSLQMTRPIGYFAARYAEYIGALVVRFLFLAPIGFTVAILLTRELPVDPRMMGAALCLSLFGSILALTQQLTIAGLAVWMDDATPIYWLWQKLVFIFGGIMVPLHLYPEPLQQIAVATPFAAMLYGPASVLFTPTIERVQIVALSQLFWGVVSASLLVLIASRASRHSARTGKG